MSLSVAKGTLEPAAPLLLHGLGVKNGNSAILNQFLDFLADSRLGDWVDFLLGHHVEEQF